jgi:hypothetical protein
MFLDYVIRIQCQQMSHDAKYRNFCKGRSFRLLAIVWSKFGNGHIYL